MPRASAPTTVGWPRAGSGLGYLARLRLSSTGPWRWSLDEDCRM